MSKAMRRALPGLGLLSALLCLPAAAQVRGGGPKASDCLAEFTAAAAADGRRIRCVDGDASCDADPTPGVCRFDVGVCLNALDPLLPGCTPRDLELYLVENVQPDTDPRHDFEFEALQTAVNTLGFPVGAGETDLCTGPVAMLLPLEVKVRSDGARWKKFAKKLRAEATGPGGASDADVLPMTCLPAEGADACADVTSTFDQIERHVFPTCARDTCHNASQSDHTLTLLPGQAYADLVGVAPDNLVARNDGQLRVDPGDPAQSFLLAKLRGDLAFGEGARMPRDLPKLSAKKIRLVEAWIEAGAPAAGFVAGIGCQP